MTHKFSTRIWPVVAICAMLTAVEAVAASAHGLSTVRFMNLSPDTPAVDVRIETDLVAPQQIVVAHWQAAAFAEPREPVPIPPDVLRPVATVRGVLAGPQRKVDLLDEAHTLLLLGPPERLDWLALAHTGGEPAAGRALARFVSAAYGGPALQVSMADGRPLWPASQFATATDYVELAAGATTIQVRRSDTGAVVATAEMSVEEGGVYSIFAAGNLAGSRPLTVLSLAESTDHDAPVTATSTTAASSTATAMSTARGPTATATRSAPTPSATAGPPTASATSTATPANATAAPPTQPTGLPYRQYFPLALNWVTGAPSHTRLAQSYETGNSYVGPNRGDLRVLFVVAQRAGASCEPQSWKTNPKQIADEWVDKDLGVNQLPTSAITTRYHQASFGQFRLLGDFLDHIVETSCSNIGCYDEVAETVAELIDSDTFKTVRGITDWKSFDSWSIPAGTPGQPKVHGPDGRIDELIVLWLTDASGNCTSCCAGYAPMLSHTVASSSVGLAGFDLVGSWYSTLDGDIARGFFQAEHLHTLFGGNHWHTNGGAGTHTFIVAPSSTGLTAQLNVSSWTGNGWDRQHLGWKAPGRPEAVMASSPNCATDVPSDLTIQNAPNGGVFCLRDFVITGDMIRIKLPPIEYIDGSQPVRNQYLILENHRLQDSASPYANNPDNYGLANHIEPGTFQPKPGVYAYYQIGKDARSGSSPWLFDDPPNDLASWFTPLPPLGNWDHAWRDDQLVSAGDQVPFSWAANIPFQRWHAETAANPLTGQNDRNLLTDNGGSPDVVNPQIAYNWSELERDGDILQRLQFGGGPEDAFGPYAHLYLGSNPVPATVYTYESWGNHNHSATIGAHENRTIHLSNLGITISPRGSTGNVRVEIRWDDPAPVEGTRWTGNVLLEGIATDPLARKARLSVLGLLDLDRGRSPAQHTKASSEAYFTQPTVLTLGPGSETLAYRKGQVAVRQGSSLHVRSGADLQIRDDAQIVVDAGASICLSPAAAISILPPARIRLNAGALTPATLGGAPCRSLTAMAGVEHGFTGATTIPPAMAYWRFNDDPPFAAADEAGGDNQLADTNVGATCAGIERMAWCFDGEYSYAATNGSANSKAVDVGSSDFTIEGWIRTTDRTGQRMILDRSIWPKTLPGAGGYSLLLEDGVLALRGFLGTVPAPKVFTSGRFLADGLWHHIAVTVKREDAAGGQFYVDGERLNYELVAGFDTRGLVATVGDANLVFGRAARADAGGHLSAAIDGFSIYNTVLSAAQVTDLFHAVGTGK